MAPRERRDPGASREETLRREMVEQFVATRGVDDPRVLEAMLGVPRHRFVPEPLRARAYGDHSLPIGHGQTISQPYVVALMTASDYQAYLKEQGN
jgi:protein-L-isoaspartate O-methyltransferase